jgi:hypothetical protein
MDVGAFRHVRMPNAAALLSQYLPEMASILGYAVGTDQLRSAQASEVFDQLPALEAVAAITQRPGTFGAVAATCTDPLVAALIGPRLSTLADTISRFTRRVLVFYHRLVDSNAVEVARLTDVFHQRRVRLAEQLGVGDFAAPRRYHQRHRGEQRSMLTKTT